VYRHSGVCCIKQGINVLTSIDDDAFFRFLEQSVYHLLSEQRLVYYLQIGRETLWPGGKFMTAAPLPTEEQQLALRIQAERKLALAMPGTIPFSSLLEAVTCS
jgi:hypothetical protein